MSIILKGIDIPPNSKVQIIVESPTESFRKQMPKSRIIQIPKGHGRLIDGDELKADIHMNRLNKYATWRDVDATYRAIDDAPTILEEEGVSDVRHL